MLCYSTKAASFLVFTAVTSTIRRNITFLRYCAWSPRLAEEGVCLNSVASSSTRKRRHRGQVNVYKPHRSQYSPSVFCTRVYFITCSSHSKSPFGCTDDFAHVSDEDIKVILQKNHEASYTLLLIYSMKGIQSNMTIIIQITRIELWCGRKLIRMNNAVRKKKM